jgi:hypothetical protein
VVRITKENRCDARQRIRDRYAHLCPGRNRQGEAKVAAEEGHSLMSYRCRHSLGSLHRRLVLGEPLHCQFLLLGIGETVPIGAEAGVVETPQ